MDKTSSILGGLLNLNAIRKLQRAYLDRMRYLMTEQPEGNRFQGPAPSMSRSDIRPLVRDQLTQLREEVERAERRIRHRVSDAHLADVLVRIDALLEEDGEG